MRYIGIDVSKAKLDLALLDPGGKKLGHAVVPNTPKGLVDCLKRWTKEELLVREECLACFEPTGHYSNNVLRTMLGAGVSTAMVHPLEIKRRMGMVRGKNDKVDAQRIADYAMRYHDQCRLVNQNTLAVLDLRHLLAFRRRVQVEKAKHQVYRSDMYPCLGSGVRKHMDPYSKERIRQARDAVAKIDALILQQIKADPVMDKQYELLLSVELVGPVLASHLLVSTERFSRMAGARQLACQAGIAPHQHSSGASVHAKARVSHHADKGLKAKLHMAALSAAKGRGELGAFYKRKVAEGKNPMSVLNAVRNKIIHRVCAVIQRGTPYVKK